MTPETCPNCGADVPSGAKCCPHCGADEHTGWSEEAYASSLNLPDESFDYDDFVQREFNEKKSPVPRGVKWFWWAAAIVVVVVFVAGLLFFHR
ncbi:MAG: hypothetical protein ABSG59_19665 [Verrucomicrobiota bacterium]|jgi:uncharacterized membrane protein YvbJ